MVPHPKGGSRNDRDLAPALQRRPSAFESRLFDTERVQREAGDDNNPKRRGCSLGSTGPKNPGRSLPAGVRDALKRGPRVGARRTPRPRPGRKELERVLREKGGNVALVAKAFDRQWNVVQRWLRRYG